VAAGEEVAAAERWLLSRPPATQSWDQPGWRAKDAKRSAALIGSAERAFWLRRWDTIRAARYSRLCRTGISPNFDSAIRTEMDIFAKLIQRRELAT